MDKQQIIDKLNDILKWEWTGVAQYAQHSFIIKGLWREVYGEMFSESAEESFKHAKTIGDKIVALGGVPTVERNEIKQSDDLVELLEIGLAFEQGAVDHYNEALKMCDELKGSWVRPLIVLLEDILLEEQNGVDDLTKLLHEADAQSGDAQKRAAG